MNHPGVYAALSMWCDEPPLSRQKPDLRLVPRAAEPAQPAEIDSFWGSVPEAPAPAAPKEDFGAFWR